MKKTLSFILAVMMLLGCMSITAFAKTGTGTEDDPYLFTSLEVNDIISATDYVKNDTEEILDYELRFIDRDTLETKLWRPQRDPGETMQFTFDEYSDDTQFIYKGFDETALWGGAYVFDVPPTPKIGGTAEITAEIKTAGFEYEMVIPTATTLTEANHENVLLGTDGKVSITNVKNPTDNVSVSYTVDLTDGNLTDGTNTINATYKYKQGDAEFAAIDGTTKVTVYENKTVNDSFVNVTANKDQWDAAPTGTYNATVVFNFSAEEKAEKIDWVITFDGADLGNVEVNMPYVFTAATAEGATAATPVTYTIEEGGSYYSIGDDLYGDPNKMNIYVLDECPYNQVTITVTYPEDDIHRETSKSAVFTYNIVG